MLCYVAPIGTATTSNLLYYNSTTKEVSYGGNIVASNNGFTGINGFSGNVNLSGNVRFNNASNSISIGSGSNTTGLIGNSIVLNATVSALSPTTTDACYMNPIRMDASQNNILNYNPTTKEVTYQQRGYLYYTHSTTQVVSGETTALFNTTNSTRNIPISGLSYNSTTGVFTNNSVSTTLFLSVVFSTGFATNITGFRGIWFRHSILGYVSFYQLPPTSDVTAFCTTAIITLLPGEWFDCRCIQTSGGNLNISTAAFCRSIVTIFQL